MNTTLFGMDLRPTEWNNPYQLIRCTRALHPTKMSSLDFTLNPYSGCEHGCVYCYAPGHTHSDLSTWRVVKVKTNIVDRLSKEIDGAEGTIGIGTVTDPYQPAEGRFMLTRMCIELLQRKKKSVFIITKSPLITRDIDILSNMDSVIAITITNPNDKISKITEPGAALPKERLETIKRLNDSGIDTTVFIAPVLSSLEGYEEELMRSISDSGVKRVYADPLNQRGTDMDRLNRMHITSSVKAEKKLAELGERYGVEVILGRRMYD